MRYDFCVIGGGIVGLATALRLIEVRPGASVVLLEKEADVGRHQTGHNSGVIHAGIYYEPGSLKARLCREGLAATQQFCRDHSIDFETPGKLIVATNEIELSRINALYDRATKNGVPLEYLSAAALREQEPNIVGVGALLSRETGIVDYGAICRSMARKVEAAGADIEYGCKVDSIVEGGNSVVVSAGERRWDAARLVVCAGLQADRLARLAGIDIDFQIVPFRGEYYRLPPNRSDLVKRLIYPAPQPELPFLGIHLTRMIDGSITVGPNAVLGLAREGYPRGSFNASDSWQFLTFAGFWKFALANSAYALGEMRNSVLRSAYLRECQKYCPDLTVDDLEPYPAGIRAQAITAAGKAIHDFRFEMTPRSLHVCNAPSPAATSALPIGRMIVERLLDDH